MMSRTVALLCVPLLSLSLVSCEVTTGDTTQAEDTPASQSQQVVDPERKDSPSATTAVDNRDNVNNAPQSSDTPTSPGVAKIDANNSPRGVPGATKREQSNRSTPQTASSARSTARQPRQETPARKATPQQQRVKKHLEQYIRWSFEPLSKELREDPDVQFFVKKNNEAGGAGVMLSDYSKKMSKNDKKRLSNAVKKIGMCTYLDCLQLGDHKFDAAAFLLMSKTSPGSTPVESVKIDTSAIIIHGARAIVPAEAVSVDGSVTTRTDEDPVNPEDDPLSTRLKKMDGRWKLSGQSVADAAALFGAMPITL